jgi:hypothetical protein
MNPSSLLEIRIQIVIEMCKQDFQSLYMAELTCLNWNKYDFLHTGPSVVVMYKNV